MSHGSARIFLKRAWEFFKENPAGDISADIIFGRFQLG